MGPGRGQLWGWGGWDQLEDSSGGGADGTTALGVGPMGAARRQLWGWGGWEQLEDSSGGGADGSS